MDRIVAIFGLFSSLGGFFLYFQVPITAAYKLPQLKAASKIPSIAKQLKSGEQADNLIVALVNLMQINSITEKSRDVFVK